VFPAVAGQASQNAFLAVTPNADCDENGRRTKAVAVFDFDILSVDKQGEEVWINGSCVAELNLLDEFTSFLSDALAALTERQLARSPNSTAWVSSPNPRA
jgi:hypothetical protein